MSGTLTFGTTKGLLEQEALLVQSSPGERE